MSFFIPTNTSLPFFSQTTTLDGTVYVLSFYYNQRESVYYLQISDTSGNILVQGVKIVSNWPLLTGYISADIPPGEFMAIAQGADDSPPALGELGIGQRCQLVYFTQSDIQNAGLETWRQASPGGA